ncbi:M15 family metallopeptidase [Demequina sp. SYSU T00192]|uniref:M15 family metallopeptidase n=1 Tax=Demequina litoralis TaxID=3051660 RepID=A0ABT8G8W3_9MICO|nr:M15 family metallopeptidase [Demequina sp. SYSU T00192]MDN4475563.1 M15 family metallopeptidase [Demequina sp. SYSU T00192]
MSAASPRRRRRLVHAAVVAASCFGLGIGAGALLPPADDWLALAGASDATAAAPTPTASATPVPGASSLAAITADPQATAVRTPEVEVTAPDVDDPDSLTVVVNKQRPLDPLDHVPDDLVTVEGIPNGVTMRAEAAAAMTALHEAAVEAGAGFSISTAYRAYGTQSSLYAGYVRSRGQDGADRFSARPGYSEHQTGLAADVSNGVCTLQACFATTAAGQYLAAHAWEHGYIVRYPAGSDAVTGYIYEPWHLRYVGAEVAAAMHDGGIATLEEYFGLDPAPDYR